jgi:EAL domain-containing protein (putative c-di-GMP-specific phosphodiesterase class I)
MNSKRFWADLPGDLAGVVIEVTEDQEGDRLDTLPEQLELFRARGARIGLDDVGAGTGEFARLATLRPDLVKIDRSLIQNCADDRGRSAVIAALAAYACHLGALVCAEGVETSAELEHLLALGVRHAQGYHLARPAPERPQPRASLSWRPPSIARTR